jgi:N-acetylglucosamine kinase-like BadF-type ATPase
VTAPLYVGIDGGGTRARAVAIDPDGRVVARREGAAGIVHPSDPCAAAEAAARLARAVLEDAAAAGAGGGDLVRRAAALCCGLAGAGRAQEREAVRVGLMLEDVAARVHVVGDAEPALEDAFGAGAGILLIAGTGSIAWARTADGRVVRVGGWGQLLGDEGSGYDVGLQALRAVARAADGRAAPTALTGIVLEGTDCRAPEDLIRFAAGAAKADIAALAPVVLDCAAGGDPAARAIHRAAVDALVELVTTVASRAGLHAPRLAFTGGLLAPGAPLRAAVADLLLQALPGTSLHTGDVDAARGAALMARRIPSA